MSRLRQWFLEKFVPHGPGDSWGVAERLLGVILVAVGIAIALTLLLHGCTSVTVMVGDGMVDDSKGAVIIKPKENTR